jgi:hypothetical protein
MAWMKKMVGEEQEVRTDRSSSGFPGTAHLGKATPTQIVPRQKPRRGRGGMGRYGMLARITNRKLVTNLAVIASNAVDHTEGWHLYDQRRTCPTRKYRPYRRLSRIE